MDESNRIFSLYDFRVCSGHISGFIDRMYNMEHSFGFGTFLYSICMVNDIKSCLNSMNEEWKKGKKFKTNIALKRLRENEGRSKMSNQLRSFIEFHGILKRFSYPS